MAQATSQIMSVSGRGIPLIGNDIDTDRIIPARFLRCVTFNGLGDNVFADDRNQGNGNHPFDQPQYQNAKILVVNSNFGCGSSREHAPQSIMRWGISGIVGESFAEIFLGNCVAIGMPCVTATSETIAQLQAMIADAPDTELTIDLEGLTISGGNLRKSVTIKDGNRQMFLNGTWDACGQLLQNAQNIKATAGTLPYVSWSKN
ncbi:3-isopropylmalate dehydratase small subunit [Leptothoe spongobia]|uniref:3-isopropylmalate dehydratase small subunit n=1 Tax=Leptothoe spongobia TAU-MAC 1115 TaxID=1967444 RepID=A0A947DK60_9CYAN|nr:3-isopropylmalate dehydratase small subunit [Leptothoe spongobia]MBT9317988.1 3-isopropylmalate dehydratase small subunit [Leptothoe spongobia TAU-MAC 1115]